jgi:DNA-binding LacI/PurR family transcriptional regulator
MAKAVKLSDVARDAGVSQGTASNVFSRPQIVRPEVRARVEASARKLGYTGPDPKGRLLRGGKVNAIGVVVSEKLTDFFNDPYNRAFMAGITAVCDERGAGVSLISAADEGQLAWNIESAVVDGFVLQCVEDGSRLVDLARRRKLPFVAIDLDAGPDMSPLDADHRSGARLAAEHLLRLGHRRIAILAMEFVWDGHFGRVDRARWSSAEDGVTLERLQGYEEAFAAAGIALDDVVIFESPNERAPATEMAAALLAAAPDVTAIVAMSDVLALAAMDAAKARQLVVPRDLSVVGFDDIPEAAAATPPLTTIHQPIVEKGRRAAELIFERGSPRKELLAVDLVVRSSTAAPRIVTRS